MYLKTCLISLRETKTAVFWDVVPSNMVDRSQSFREICSVHLQSTGGNVAGSSNMVTYKYQTMHHHIPKKGLILLLTSVRTRNLRRIQPPPPKKRELPASLSSLTSFIFTDVNNTTVCICVLH